MSVPIVRSRAQLRSILAGWRGARETLALIPTMGALHEGHLSLVRAGLAAADRIVVSLFVNPRQFDNPDDLAAYPRTEEEDAALLAPLGVDLLYAPGAGEMYPDGFATTVSVSGLGKVLCGAHRPGHFDGVATVVAKLFLQTGANLAFFGEKDFQQLQIVRRMAMDLDIPIRIVPCPTVREPDGLAMSSRNRHLAADERAIAPALWQTLSLSATRIATGAPVETVLAEARTELVRKGFRKVEYLELRSESDLAPLTVLAHPARLLAAAWLGRTRLIDNVRIVPQDELVSL